MNGAVPRGRYTYRAFVVGRLAARIISTTSRPYVCANEFNLYYGALKGTPFRERAGEIGNSPRQVTPLRPTATARARVPALP